MRMSAREVLAWSATGVWGAMLFLSLVSNALERSELDLRVLEARERREQRKRAEAPVITCTACKTPPSG